MSKDLECPYCDTELEVCHDDGFGYEEDVNHEMRCYECNKNFVFQTCISYTYEASKADCLNGSPHDLKVSVHKNCTIERCRDCDYERWIWETEEEEACQNSQASP